MSWGLGVLTFGTLGFAAAFGLLSVRAIEKHRASGLPKSSLSKDGIAERIAASSVK